MLKYVAVVALLTMTVTLVIGYVHLTRLNDPFRAVFNEHCAVCHGENLEGNPQGPPLVGAALTHGESVAAIRRSIATGYESSGMPAWSHTLDDAQIASLAIYVAERRLDFDMGDYNVTTTVSLPADAIETEHYRVRIESFAADLDPVPYSIAPMPDGGFLLTERTRGLSIISPGGEQSALIEGTPKAYGYGPMLGGIELPRVVLRPKTYLGVGLGWLLDVALHPEYESNGWVYLHYGDRCEEDCNEASKKSISPVSMNRLDRGRIRDGKWVDVETIWQADLETYTSVSDRDAGGRIAFDDRGHVFISVGIKGGYYQGVQDLDLPYGKIHRVNDDGSIPLDNPFGVEQAASGEAGPGVSTTRHTVWTYGHRSPQGLEFNHQTGEMWSTEHGPRGGDEVNRLLPGRNYGWPLHSKGLNYDGTPVEYGEELKIDFELKDIEQPVVDFTPSPAISSFVFYDGDAFPEWQHDILVGSLKAAALYRLEIENDELVHREMIVEDLARIRDVEVGSDGLIYLLLENDAGGQIVRLVPEAM